LSFDAKEFLAQGLADRYELSAEIGRGGMATVVRARDRKHDRDVAIKVLRPELDLGSEDRFLREVGIVARLNHPHILPLHDSGVSDGVRYFVMPFVKGGSLRERLQRERQLPVDDAVAIIRQVARALSYAHAQGVVHRDIKPENILVHEGQPVLADFGIALATGGTTRLTGSGMTLGTPEYVSPEQALGEEDIDARSDVYSLACVLYELLAGEPPFVGPNARSVLTKRLVDAPPSVRRLRPGVSAAIDEAILEALARAPADRTPSAAAFAERLSAPESVRPRSPVVAVLPFLNLSSDPDNEFFADGITEDVIVHLSKLRTLDVISRASVMPFKQRTQRVRDIAASLNAGSLLDGSVRRAGSRVRIVAQLIDARTEQPLWSSTYDRDLTDIFAIQTDVALQIAGALRAELTTDERLRLQREPTTDLTAYELYLRGRYFVTQFTKTGLMKAITLFQEAIAADENFALAYANQGQTWVELGESGHVDPSEAYPRARALVEHALELDPHLATAHASLGYLKVVSDQDWSGAERAFQRALEIEPNNADALDHYGRLCAALGRFDEVLSLQKRAYEIDPLEHRSDIVNAHLRAGQFEEALEIGERLLTSDPGYDRLQATTAWAYYFCGRHDDALAAMQRATVLSPDSSMWMAQLGQMLAMLGREQEARAILARLEARAATQYVSPYHFAYVYTGLAEYETALDWLERAYRERAGAIYGIRGSFLFAPLREHPRFIALLRRMNLA
jgi:serine/threonine-protein kinase